MSATVRSPPEIAAVGGILGTSGTSTVTVTEAEVDAPSLSVALKVTTDKPLGKGIVAERPEATTEPSISHCELATVPSLSVAVVVKLTNSPSTPSVSATVRSPPIIDIPPRHSASESHFPPWLISAPRVITTLYAKIVPSVITGILSRPVAPSKVSYLASPSAASPMLTIEPTVITISR